MASFEQDFIIFEDDTLLLRYTFTDLEGNFNGTEAVWWGAWDYNDWTGSTGAIAHQKFDNWNGDSPGPSNTGTNDINVVSGDVIVNVFFEQDDFTADSGPLSTDTEYYTELVISSTTSENDSVVAATGKLFVSRSMFSEAGFRPV